MTRAQLSKYESGRELPRLTTLERLLAGLSVSRQDFFLTLQLIDQQATALEALPEEERAGGLRAEQLDRLVEELIAAVLRFHQMATQHQAVEGQAGWEPRSR